MSKESVQFIEMIRQAAAKHPAPLEIPRYCEVCGEETNHLSTMLSKTREKIECTKCGTAREYRTG